MSEENSSEKLCIILFSGDLDKAIAAFIIANGALAMDMEVSMFFPFWGINVLRKERPPRVVKDFISRMFGWMMPRGASRLKLSKMNMMGMGSAMMRRLMKKKNVISLPDLIRTAQESGARLIACGMSMDVMGIKMEELIEGVELGGVGTFLGEASEAKTTLFI